MACAVLALTLAGRAGIAEEPVESIEYEASGTEAAVTRPTSGP
jgi:hypothetical protein